VVTALSHALSAGDPVFATGLVLQEALQGFCGSQARDRIVERSAPFVTPERRDHIEAAELRNACRRRGHQVGTIDALLAQLCIRRELVLSRPTLTSKVNRLGVSGFSGDSGVSTARAPTDPGFLAS
jgi:predicted nucleic acid-binding protein